MAEVTEYVFKVLVVGDVSTGKTSIIKRYVHGSFSTDYRATIGVDFALKVINWDSKTVVRLQLWDIAGQERFGSMTRVYYKEAVGAFLVFDVTRAGTFDVIQKWKSDIDFKVKLSDDRPIPVVLLANKVDLATGGWYQTPEQMNKYCEENGFIGWFETSAKDNIGIDKATKFLLTKIFDNIFLHDDRKPEDTNNNSSNVIVPQPEQKSGCC